MCERTNDEWVADLKGERGEDAQSSALIDMHKYLFIVSFNRLKDQFDDRYYADSYSEDFVQITLCRIAENDFARLEQYSGKGKFLHWVATICHRVISRGITSKWFPNNRHQTEFTEKHENIAASSANRPEEVVEVEEENATVDECLELLPHDKRIALDKYLRDKNAKELAQIIGCTPNNVYTLIHRAKIEMEKCLKQKGFS